MANTSFTRPYNDFATATFDKFTQASFEDNISRGSPALSFMLDDGKITKRGAGRVYQAGATGDRIEEPLMTELNETGKWIDGAEEVDDAQQNVGTAAFFQAKELAITTTITGKEKRRNKGRERTIDLLKAKSDQSMISARKLLAGSIWSDGTGSNGKEIYGFLALMPSDRGVGTAYGEVDANTAWWLCQRSRSGTTYGNVGDFMTEWETYGIRLFNDCSEGNMVPDCHFVTQECAESYWSLLRPTERQMNKTALDLGYEHVMSFMGKPVFWDRYHPDAGATSQRWFMVNSEFMRLRYSPEANFTSLGFQRATKGDKITNLTIWEGALTTNCRRMFGVATGITGVT